MTISHAQLVARAIHHLRTARKCQIVLSEMQCNWLESPDAIGFSKQHSTLIECKTSRSDFSRDSRKASRRPGVGMGYYRFYLVPAGVVRRHEVNGFDAEIVTTSGWGLLWYHTGGDRITVEKPSIRFDVNRQAENLFLVSALHRVQLRLSSPLHEYIRWAQNPLPARVSAVS